MLEPRPEFTLEEDRPTHDQTVIEEMPAQKAFASPAYSGEPKRKSPRNAFLFVGGALVLILGLCAVSLFAGVMLMRGSTAFSMTRPRASTGNIASRAATQATPKPVVIVAPPENGVDYETAVLINIYEQVNPSVVSIIVLGAASDLQSPFGNPDPNDLLPFSNGSGFVWDADGHIVTNNHVVEGAKQVQITFSDGTQSIAEVVGTDPDSDLAVVKIDPTGYNLAPVRRGDQNSLRVGMRVAAIGNPFGLEGTLTSGIISAMGRSIPGTGQFSIADVIQTDAAINPGNSGGPLMNEAGEVIGVNAQIRSAVRANSGVGFAIPIRIVDRVIPALIANGGYAHSYIGVEGRTFSPICADDLGLSPELRGAMIIRVLGRTPAARAGLQGGDTAADTRFTGICPNVTGGDIVMAIEGQLVTSFDDVLVYLQRFTSPGDVVALTVLRNGEEFEIDVTLGRRPSRVR